MSAIDTYLNYIASKDYARDVRTAIVNAIRECYNDVNSPTLREAAFIAAIEAELENGHLTGLDLGDGDVTTAKIANGAVTTTKIADGAITQAKLDPNIEFVQVDDTLTQAGEAADAKAAGDALSIPIEQSNYYDHLINYGYNQAYNLPIASGSGNQVGIKRLKTLITLNTSGGNSAAVYIRLDGEMVRTGTASDIANWTGGIPLVDGHIYEIVVRYLSGSSVLSNALYVPIVAARAIGTASSPSISAETVGNEYHRTFKADDQNWLFFVNVSKNANLSNAKFLVTVCDLTASDGALKAKIDDMEFEETQLSTGNLFDYKTATEGASVKVADGTLYTGGSQDKFASDYIEVTPGKRYILIPHYAYGSGGIYGMAFYDSSKAYISGAVHGTSASVSYLKTWVFVVPDNENIVYMRFTTIRAYLKQTYLAEYTWERLRTKAKFVSYEGEPIDLTPIGARVAVGYKMDIGSQHQDSAVWGDEMFIFADSSYTSAWVLNLTTYELVPLSMNNWGDHNSTVGFTRSFYSSDDSYPIICLSGEQTHKSHFFRIIKNEDTYTATKLMSVNYPSFVSSHQSPECIIDSETNMMYIRAVMNGDTITSKNLKLIKYAVPDQFNSDISLESVPYSEDHPYGYLDIIPCQNYKFNGNGSLQGCVIFNGKLFNACGLPGSECLNVIDMRDGRRVAWIDLTPYMTGEPESCVYYKGRIIITERETRLLYEIYT